MRRIVQGAPVSSAERYAGAKAAPELEPHDWPDIRGQFEGAGPTGAILMGNGLSRGIWDGFSYGSLLDKASGGTIANPLTAADLAIFRELDTKNFESVLHGLHTAALIARARHESTAALDEHYHRIRRALVEAVKAVHVPWDWVGEATRRAIGEAMRRHANVYAINYDLLPYWAVMTIGVAQFLDYFFALPDQHSFDPHWLPERGARTRLLFPHGALHLVRRWSGVTSKLTNDGRNLLDRFGEEPQAEPLFVSEGTGVDKRNALRSSDYLTFVYEQLTNDPGPFVLFGVGLGDEDAHIAEALNRKGLRIAVGLHGGSDDELRAKAAGFVKVLSHTRPVFFRSTTHPLGAPTLKAEQPRAPIAAATELDDAGHEAFRNELFGDEQ